ncbi:MAG: tetratricopeptide repeat protein, partial [Pseudomonadota bacterium]
ADYVSLLETRWLLGQMHRVRSTWAQALVLVADALVSGAIIWGAIALYVWSPLYDGEIDSFAEILGVFSIFSVAFYSTFLTSLWTWAYILTTWLMRLSAGLNLAYWVDWEKKPVAILSTMLAAVSFAATFALSIPLERDAEGLSLVDRTLCTVFKGPVCLDVQRLTPSEQARLEFLLLACEGGLTGECLRRGTAGWETAPAEAARLFRVACDGGNALGCTNLGFQHVRGLGVAADAGAAARLYRQGCDGGHAAGCTNLGVLHRHGLGVAADAGAAARLFRQGCDGGNARGCTNLGYLHEQGLGVAADAGAAARLFRQGCNGGHARGCTNLGVMHGNGHGMEADPATAVALYRRACEGDHGRGCAYLGQNLRDGIGVAVDRVAAGAAFAQACALGFEDACEWGEALAAE